MKNTRVACIRQLLMTKFQCLQMLEQGDIALAIDPDEDDEDAEDDEIRVTDSLLVVAITEDEYSHLEVCYDCCLQLN
jgi:hypothetical protein